MKTENLNSDQADVTGSCIELAEKSNGRIYYTEKCGCKSKYKIQYELKGKLVEKPLCKRHFKSVTAWLDRINVQYNCL